MRTSRWSIAAAFIFLAATILPDTAAAQVRVNFAAGPVLADVSTDDPDFDDSETKFGFFAAAGTSFQLSEMISVNPWLGYVQKGTKFGDEKLKYDYLEIPVLLAVGFPIGESGSAVNVFAGPQVGFQINCDEAGFDCSDLDSRKSTEFGVMAGAGLMFPAGENGAFSVGVGADFGLTDLFDVPSGASFKTRTYFLSLGYSTAVGGSMGGGM